MANPFTIGHSIDVNTGTWHRHVTYLLWKFHYLNSDRLIFRTTKEKVTILLK